MKKKLAKEAEEASLIAQVRADKVLQDKKLEEQKKAISEKEAKANAEK